MRNDHVAAMNEMEHKDFSDMDFQNGLVHRINAHEAQRGATSLQMPASSQDKSCNSKIKPRLLAVTVIAGLIGLIALSLLWSSIFHVQEGHVAVLFRGGALQNETLGPGYHLKVPWLTDARIVQITIQTDEVSNVPCGTQGGVMIYFDRIEVVNILNADAVLETVRKYTTDYDKPLIYNKVHHEINQFCSKHTIQEVYIDLFDKIDENLKSALQAELQTLAPGLFVQSVRVTKPKIPNEIRQNYEQMEAEKTKLLVAVEHQRVVEKEAETDRKRALIEAEKKSQVAAVEYKQVIAQKEAQKTVNKLEDEIHIAKEKANADASFYKAQKQAEANAKLLSPQFLDLKKIEAIKENNKIYYGDSIPKARITRTISVSKVHGFIDVGGTQNFVITFQKAPRADKLPFQFVKPGDSTDSQGARRFPSDGSLIMAEVCGETVMKLSIAE
ncbi:unnamed protein product, partial [Mesorhabditis belari]|uniref:Band 7 domain-containing protein n=1 Tax=Mesorhabditis belari TaxID=2138241 RepID=A0AAF3FL66_9BILA